ncbi:MAG TPA: sulfite exporter TauE/SafE family protein [Candidatus Acutalibacter stercorigallinarum]|nr:sulfite exporter TauE/SafE family protein [Candidatus Acutalibacter stercorigallinarum]
MDRAAAASRSNSAPKIPYAFPRACFIPAPSFAKLLQGVWPVPAPPYTKGDFLYTQVFFSRPGAHWYHTRKKEGQRMRQTGKFTVSGALAGLCNGLFGAGGGLFLVPLFTRWAGMDQRRAFATSVAVVLPLSLVSAGVYLCRGAVDLAAAWPYLLGGFAGGLLSGRVFTKVPVGWLRRGFGALLLYGGVRAVLAL